MMEQEKGLHRHHRWFKWVGSLDSIGIEIKIKSIRIHLLRYLRENMQSIKDQGRVLIHFENLDRS